MKLFSSLLEFLIRFGHQSEPFIYIKICCNIWFSGTSYEPPVIPFFLPLPKFCQATLSKPLLTCQDCTRCLATLVYLTFNQAYFKLVVPCKAQIKQTNKMSLSAFESVGGMKVGCRFDGIYCQIYFLLKTPKDQFLQSASQYEECNPT